MKWSEAFVSAVAIISVICWLGMGIPACMEKQRHAVLECLKAHPAASPIDCEASFKQ